MFLTFLHCQHKQTTRLILIIFCTLTGDAQKKATQGKSSANFIDDQRDDGTLEEFLGYNYPHSEHMLSVSI